MEHETERESVRAPARARGERVGARSRVVSVATRAAVCVVVLALAGVVFWVLVGSRPEVERSPDGARAPVIEAVRATRAPVSRTWEGYGTARAMNAADVPAEVSAVVVERPARIEPGASVEAGELLVRLEERDFADRASASGEVVAALEADLAGLEVEEASLVERLGLAEQEEEVARRDHERAVEAEQRGAGSASEVDRRLTAWRASERVTSQVREQVRTMPTRRAALTARLASERAALRQAERDLGRTRVTAPIAGVLQSVGPELGEMVSAGQPVARVVDLSRVEVPLRLAVSASDSVGVGDEVELRGDGASGGSWTGRVSRIAPEADAGARSLTVFVEVEQDASGDGLLVPGRFVVGSVRGGRTERRVVVPRRAVESDRVLVAERVEAGPEGGEVWQVRPVGVKVAFALAGELPGVDPEESEWAVLEDGALGEGALVIVSNLEQLRAGMIVDPRDRGTGPGAGPGAGAGVAGAARSAGEGP